MKPISRGSKAGFTLVELIVVIAILAILAGVAIPVYSGYIEKANKAADETLLAAVNTAYGAACLENNADPRSVSASATLTDGKLTSVAPYNESFARYFAGNENSQFKHFASLIYNRTDGVFKGYGEGETISYAYSYTDSDGVLHTGTLNVDASQLRAYLGSTYDEMGATALSGKIDALVAKTAAEMSNGALGPEFEKFCTDKGIIFSARPDNYDELSADEKNAIDLKIKQEKANAMVLWMASKANADSGSSWYQALNENGSLGDPNDIASATATYALMAAFCSDPNNRLTTVTEARNEVWRTSDEETSHASFISSIMNAEESQRQSVIDNWLLQNGYPEGTSVTPTWNSNGTKITKLDITIPSSSSSVDASEWFATQTNGLTGLASVGQMWDAFSKSSEFSNYVSTRAESDLLAYAAALNMVNENLSNVDVNSIMSQGWADGGIADLIASITGNP